MLDSLVMLASYGLSTGGATGNLLFQLEQQGIFSYVLPFLMIFAILYGILSKINIFGDNKGINIILSLSVALMSLQLNFVSYFFQEIFPRMGVLLSIILVVMVLLGLFFDFKSSQLVKWIMGILVTVGVIIIIAQSLDIFSWIGGYGYGGNIGYWFRMNGGAVLTIILVVGGLIGIIASGKRAEKKDSNNDFAKLVRGMTSAD